ncbi:NifB/NifX family molybdenum-iron cluster-binding protein [Syntrophobacter fumaroxidans]|uniref:FeMo cofactor biosynthesis protein NifB n=1 Tax=Syntrophobacter fumaroxidans (strain DSM 10017 / MPOB) TaxID=335543 RepID=A0LH03_SYNFM|nr:NifB/NifX family molybdenum-iron cluster-binding protein [Syntrophobacter fumaroxidans]ABK16705.1 nitrogenase cofactor biosynthesis protein NifB [Syntrophobacter fumaroxidans MPOB]
MKETLDLSRHPCFNAAVKGSYGRVHLPVAARCNIRCNYCNRKYDCVDESRPGVTSALLSPTLACRYLERVLEREPRIAVAGIAGPGDPFAEPGKTLQVMRSLRERFPRLLLCLSTNGLGIGDHLDGIVKIGISHVTITVNAVDPGVGMKIYSWVRDGKVIYRGLKGAQLLLERQLNAIEGLKRRGVTVKVNTIVVPSINDGHVEAVARRMGELGVDVLNCMPMHPNKDTPFEHIAEPGREMIEEIRATAGKYLPQMRHCARCRADAVGLLGEDRGEGARESLTECAGLPAGSVERPYVAVATMEGLLVNQHLGEAHRFQIWSRAGDGYRCVEERAAPEPGGGIQRWTRLAEMLGDCRAVLVAGIGDNPAVVLREAGVQPIELNGFIEPALDAVFSGHGLKEFKARRRGGCSNGFGCLGSGEGC